MMVGNTVDATKRAPEPYAAGGIGRRIKCGDRPVEGTDGLVQCAEREELPVAQLGDNEASRDLNRDLDLGFVPRRIRPQQSHHRLAFSHKRTDGDLMYSPGVVANFQALGHTVRLMPPAYVKPYVKRAWRRQRRP
jgi:hypothetical protein